MTISHLNKHSVYMQTDNEHLSLFPKDQCLFPINLSYLPKHFLRKIIWQTFIRINYNSPQNIHRKVRLQILVINDQLEYFVLNLVVDQMGGFQDWNLRFPDFLSHWQQSEC